MEKKIISQNFWSSRFPKKNKFQGVCLLNSEESRTNIFVVAVLQTASTKSPKCMLMGGCHFLSIERKSFGFSFYQKEFDVKILRVKKERNNKRDELAF